MTIYLYIAINPTYIADQSYQKNIADQFNIELASEICGSSMLKVAV